MSHREHSARRFRFQRLVRANPAASGLHHLDLGAALAPASAVFVLHVFRPAGRFYIQLLAAATALLSRFQPPAASDAPGRRGIEALVISGPSESTP